MQKSRKRAVSNWQPTWSLQIENWTAKQIHKNLWRYDCLNEFQDLMQEARLLFFVLSKKYPIVNEASHFFALYRTSLTNMFTDKARVMQKSVIDKNANAEEIAEEFNLEGIPNYGLVNLLVDELPDELKIVLRALTSGRVRLKVDRPPARSFRCRENHNMRLKRRFSLSMDDPVGALKAHFSTT